MSFLRFSSSTCVPQMEIDGIAIYNALLARNEHERIELNVFAKVC